MKILTTLAIGVSIILVCGCSRPITGQIFAVSQVGLNFPLGAVEIEVVKRHDADAFIRQREREIEAQIKYLRENYDEAKTNYDVLSQIDLSAQQAASVPIYTNNPQYRALLGQKSEDEKTLEELSETVEDLTRRAYPTWGAASTTPVSSSEWNNRAAASNMARNDNARIYDIDSQIAEINRRCAIIEQDTMAPLREKLEKAFYAVRGAQTRLENEARAMNAFPTSEDYLNDFNVPPIETTVSDSGGNFELENTEPDEEVFVKAQWSDSDVTNDLYWLVDIPQNRQKLILSNQNLFAPNI